MTKLPGLVCTYIVPALSRHCKVVNDDPLFGTNLAMTSEVLHVDEWFR